MESLLSFSKPYNTFLNRKCQVNFPYFLFLSSLLGFLYSQEEKVTYPHHQNDYSLILLKQFHILFLNLRNRASILVSIMK